MACRARGTAHAETDGDQESRQQHAADEPELGERLELERMRLGDRLARASAQVVPRVVVARSDTVERRGAKLDQRHAPVVIAIAGSGNEAGPA